jgi:hypothetical protein
MMQFPALAETPRLSLTTGQEYKVKIHIPVKPLIPPSAQRGTTHCQNELSNG